MSGSNVTTLVLYLRYSYISPLPLTDCNIPCLFQVILIAKLLHTLPESSSAVITSADSIIQELFTHKGKFEDVVIIAVFSLLFRQQKGKTMQKIQV